MMHIEACTGLGYIYIDKWLQVIINIANDITVINYTKKLKNKATSKEIFAM